MALPAVSFEMLGTDEGVLLMHGLFVRALSLVLALTLFSFAVQLPQLAGAHGLQPLGATLARYRRDLGLRQAVWFFPTLFWATGASRAALVGLPLLGAGAAAGAALGGAAAPWLLAFAWLVLLSIDAGPYFCYYPWDSLLLEAGFLALWLPPTHVLQPAALAAGDLGSLCLQALPSRLLAFALRWLLARLLLGFGKLKFIGSGWNDRLYIRGFLMGQPMCVRARACVYSSSGGLMTPPPPLQGDARRLVRVPGAWPGGVHCAAGGHVPGGDHPAVVPVRHGRRAPGGRGVHRGPHGGHPADGQLWLL
jgi:hypothetical protein